MINKNRVMMQKEKNRIKKLTIKLARYYALRDKVRFVKLI